MEWKQKTKAKDIVVLNIGFRQNYHKVRYHSNLFTVLVFPSPLGATLLTPFRIQEQKPKEEL